MGLESSHSSCTEVCTSALHSAIPIYRRLATASALTGAMSQVHQMVGSASAGTRISHSCSEIPTGPHPVDHLPRLPVQFQSGHGVPSGREMDQGGPSHSPLSVETVSNGSHVAECVRAPGSSRTHGAIRNGASETSAIGTEKSMVPDTRSVGRSSSDSVGSPTCVDLVDHSIPGVVRSPVPTATPDPGGVYGRFPSWLGWSPGRGYHIRNLDPRRSSVPHQLVGVGGGDAHVSTFCRPIAGQSGPSCHRQYNGNVIHQCTRRDEVSLIVHKGSGDSPVGSGTRHYSQGEAYSGPTECGSRFAQQIPSGVADRMVTQPQGISGIVPCLGHSPDRSLCHEIQQQATDVHVSHAGSHGISGRLSVTEVGRDVGLRLPSCCNHTSGSSQGTDRRGTASLNSTKLASPKVVSANVRAVGRATAGSPVVVGFAAATTQQGDPQSCGQAQPSRLDVMQESLVEAGFSHGTASRIAAPQRSSTLSVYQSKWRRYCNWCDARSADPLKTTPPVMAEFFLELFQSGLAPGTVEGYRSAISHTFKNTGNWDVGANAQLTSLINNMYQQKPKVRPSAPEWDLTFVLQQLTEPPFEPMSLASLEHITLKTVFLLAFASGRRRGEIHALQDKGLTHSRDWTEVTIHTSPDFVAKTHIPRKGTTSMVPLTIPALKRILGPNMQEDRLLCPVRALRYYLDKTQPIRGTRTRLFIAYKKGHKGDIAVTTIASWIKRAIIRAYQRPSRSSVQQFYPTAHAHQLRSLAASWAAAGAIPFEDIMTACQWKSPTTFTSYYLCDMTAVRANMLTLGPIVAAQSVVPSSLRGASGQ
jgi:integrase